MQVWICVCVYVHMQGGVLPCVEGESEPNRMCGFVCPYKRGPSERELMLCCALLNLQESMCFSGSQSRRFEISEIASSLKNS